MQWAVVLVLDKEIRDHQEPQASFFVSAHKNNSFMGDTEGKTDAVCDKRTKQKDDRLKAN